MDVFNNVDIGASELIKGRQRGASGEQLVCMSAGPGDKFSTSALVRCLEDMISHHASDFCGVQLCLHLGFHYNWNVVEREEAVFLQRTGRNVLPIPNEVIDGGALEGVTRWIPSTEGAMITRERNPLDKTFIIRKLTVQLLR